MGTTSYTMTLPSAVALRCGKRLVRRRFRTTIFSWADELNSTIKWETRSHRFLRGRLRSCMGLPEGRGGRGAGPTVTPGGRDAWASDGGSRRKPCTGHPLVIKEVFCLRPARAQTLKREHKNKW